MLDATFCYTLQYESSAAPVLVVFLKVASRAWFPSAEEIACKQDWRVLHVWCYANGCLSTLFCAHGLAVMRCRCHGPVLLASLLDGVACAAVALASLGLHVPFVAVESDASLKEAAFSCFAKTWHFGDVLDFRVSSLPSKLNRAQFWMVPVAVPTHVLASSLMCAGSLTRLALSVQCLAPRHLLYLGECPASAYFILKCCIQGLQQ